MPEFQFVKSSYSGQLQECVEVARNIPHTIAVRDSKAPTGPHLLLTPTTWHAFIHSPWTR
ncbi:DUF397 domain-containing protein [Streptomyces acidiscabies]|uniref:DUF397 domain-containing protein n=1 Tax=Streptomyces acidiscabies TaxID=42234 RepID=A0AAP6BE57_9ACTN|nr:DUF397 domain-containing protein [Streptomyces acidiscabies]MBP5939579.1 DUF397 domain-containing protein [Streptomyces sp. LBUM 1476]MBZ3910742.1 DUF397 domain-containing protein [Streptomyces acidiscabies]MDX2963076.1 DUF397 domain-containing protein [Streptomyces acidiscabies]MDX3017378.1 DUF397 domain-containing protein [Streptomyces acidiscabies]MDX3787854.1 DUF397 domain-containing protein [Streptomyces acidiscabies]